MAHRGDHTESCGCRLAAPSTHQTLDELEFDRGIWSASLNGETKKIEKFLNGGGDPNVLDSSGYTALHYAARNGHVDVCKLLLNHRATVDATTRSGLSTPLHRAAYGGRKDIVRLLLERGASICLQDADGKTALHKAVEGNHVDIIRMLIDVDANIKCVKDNHDKNPFDYVSDGRTDIKELLL